VPDEQARASLTRIRGQQAAKMPTSDAKTYASDSAKMDKNYAGVELQTDLTARKQGSAKVMGSFHNGGTVPETGTYKLEAGEQVIPTRGRYRFQESGDTQSAGKGNGSGSDGARFPQPDVPFNNRKSSAIRGTTNGDGFSAHKGQAGGPFDQYVDLCEGVKRANKEAKDRYNATHRYSINGGE
jgi:hypothetical protein